MKKILTILISLVIFAPSVLALSFSDVSNKHMYYKEIKQLAKDEVVQGYDDDTFKPSKVINRAEFLKIAIGVVEPDLFKKDKDKEEYEDCFEDVSDEWFAPYACYAKEQDWVGGYSDGTFRPENNINFGEALAIIARIFELDVEDFDSTEWYYPYQRYFDIFDLVGNIEQSMDFQVNRGEMSHLVYEVQEHLDDMSSKKIKAEIEEQKEMEEFKLEVFHLVNEARIENGKKALNYNIQLEKAAQMHAEDMVDRDFFAHVSPDGIDVMTRVKTFKYDQRDTGENIALGQVDPDDVMNSWLNSPPHLENLLWSNFTEMGVGVISAGEDQGYSWVQVFGKPCEERDNIIGCTTRSDYQERNEEKDYPWESPYTWY